MDRLLLIGRRVAKFHSTGVGGAGALAHTRTSPPDPSLGPSWWARFVGRVIPIAPEGGTYYFKVQRNGNAKLWVNDAEVRARPSRYRSGDTSPTTGGLFRPSAAPFPPAPPRPGQGDRYR